MSETDRARAETMGEVAGGHACFAGRWLAPDGGVHRIERSGDDLQLDSIVDDTAALHGRGTVIDEMAVIDVVDALGNRGRFELTLVDDGLALTGRHSGPMGQTAIRLTRQA